MEPFIPIQTPSRILVVCTRRIGDVFLTLPLIHSLKTYWPSARIDLLVFSGTGGMGANCPDIDQIIEVEQSEPWAKRLKSFRQLWRRYDLALSALTSDRATLYAWAAGGKTVGMIETETKPHWKHLLLDKAVPFDNRNMHTVNMNLMLADAVGVPRVVAWPLSVTAAAQEKVNAALKPIGRQPYVVLHTYPKFRYKMWRIEAWVALCEWLVSQGFKPVFTGSPAPEELSYVAAVASRLPETLNLAGTLGLADYVPLFNGATAYVGPDTALTHLAAALGIPTIALYGPSNPVKWGPWPKDFTGPENPFHLRGSQKVGNVFLVQGAGNCVPCMQEGCERHVESTSLCLEELQPETVISAIKNLLQIN